MVNSVRNCLLLVLQIVRQMVNVTISRSLTVCRPLSYADCLTCTEKPVHVFAIWFSTYFPCVCVSTHKINWNFGQCSRFVIAGFLVHSTCLTLLRWLLCSLCDRPEYPHVPRQLLRPFDRPSVSAKHQSRCWIRSPGVHRGHPGRELRQLPGGTSLHQQQRWIVVRRLLADICLLIGDVWCFSCPRAISIWSESVT